MSGTTTLITDLQETQSDVTELQPYIVKVDEALMNVIDVLSDIHDVSDALDKLDKGLSLVNTVLTPLTPLPYVGSAVSAVKKGVTAMDKVAHPVATKAVQLDKKLQPLKTNLEKVEAKVSETERMLVDLKKHANYFETTLDTTYTCLQKKNATDLMKAEDKFSDGVDPEVRLLNKALGAATRECKKIERNLQAIERAASNMVDVKKPMNEVEKVIDQINKALGPIQKALKQKITVPYSVKVKVKVTKKKWWKVFTFWDWKWETTNFSFTVQQILDGINTGIEFVNDELMKLAEAILKELNIKMPTMPEIPGLSALEDEIDDVLGFVSQIKRDLDDVIDDLDNVIGGLAMIQNATKKFDIKC